MKLTCDPAQTVVWLAEMETEEVNNVFTVKLMPFEVAALFETQEIPEPTVMTARIKSPLEGVNE